MKNKGGNFCPRGSLFDALGKICPRDKPPRGLRVGGGAKKIKNTAKSLKNTLLIEKAILDSNPDRSRRQKPINAKFFCDQRQATVMLFISESVALKIPDP